MGLYPGSKDSPNRATVYGPLPTHGFDEVALVLHTTETAGMPGFNDGDTAPHYVYDPGSREWTMWAEYEDGYVGTLKGHSAGHYNCKAFQVEILAYSGNGLPWVGDFGDEQYTDLAGFVAWAMDRYPIGLDVTPTPPGGWTYGALSSDRMTDQEWEPFTGLTAHGAVPSQNHWDTGVLDLKRIYQEALDMAPFTHFELGQAYPEWEPYVWLLFMLAGGTVDPNKPSSQVTYSLPYRTGVELVQAGDLDRIASITGASDWTRGQWNTTGLYRYGKELSALQERAFR